MPLTDYRPFGTTPGASKLAREGNKVRQTLDQRQPELSEVTIASLDTATVQHGLRAIPSLVTVTPISAPALYAVTERTEQTVTVENGTAAEVTFQVAVYR